ncbi:MAG: hypothetical protein ACRDHY_16930 [Anaerolineales bacterium]
MVFVPVPPPRFQPSPRAQDLSRRLAQVIEEFERQYPGTSPSDVQQAMELAVGRSAGRPAARRTAAVAAAVLAAVAAGAVALIRSSGDASIPLMAIVTGVAVVVAIVVVVGRMRKE